MHEMSLCESILDILEQQAGLQQYQLVKVVWLEIGALSCVEPAAMRFCFDAVMEGSLASQAKLEIINVERRAWCGQCAKEVVIEQDILGKNNQYAAANRDYFKQHGILALNLVSSPGFGKTTLLTETIALLQDSLVISVIEGDQQTTHDAERIRATGVKALQINTGSKGGCHLDAHQVGSCA